MATITRLRGCENTPCADGSLIHAAHLALWDLSLRPPSWGTGEPGQVEVSGQGAPTGAQHEETGLWLAPATGPMSQER